MLFRCLYIYIYINGNCSLPCSVFYPNFYIRQYVVVDMKIMGFFNMMWLRKQYLKMLVYVCLSTELSSGYNLNTALLAYWGRVTHICVSNLTIIGRRQAIIGTNADFLLIRTLRNKLQWSSYISIQENAFENAICEVAATLARPQCVNSILYDPVFRYTCLRSIRTGRHFSTFVRVTLGLLLLWIWCCGIRIIAMSFYLIFEI